MVNKKQENEKIIAGLSYVIIGLIWYLMDENYKKNEFVKFHVKQGLNLILIGIILNASVEILSYISFGIFRIISWAFGFIFLVLWIIGIINVINNETKEVPIIGQFAKNYLKF